MTPYYEHAGITLYHADWRECELGHHDLLLTDPPYGIGEAAGKSKSRRNLAVAKDYGDLCWDDEAPSSSDVQWMRSFAKSQIIFGGNYFALPPSKCFLVWDKMNGGSDFADCELAWTNLNKAVRLFRYMWNGMLKEYPEQRFHPTQKPLALMKWCISLVPSAKTLVDPYAGSGTSLVAAKHMGLKATGVEREESYCEIIAKRLSQEVMDFA
jgi:DNA modification methylase